MVKVRLKGLKSVAVGHKLWLPGEVRELSEKQARQVEALWPGRFEWEGKANLTPSPSPSEMERGVDETEVAPEPVEVEEEAVEDERDFSVAALPQNDTVAGQIELVIDEEPPAVPPLKRRRK